MPRRPSGRPVPCSSTPKTWPACAGPASPPSLMANDLAEVSARFGAALRQAGLPVGLGRCERFAAAVTVAQPRTKHALYLCALATLISDHEQAVTLQAVFDQVFEGLGELAVAAGPGADSGPPARSADDLLARAARAAQSHAAIDLATAFDVDRNGGDPAAADHDDEVEDRFLGTSAERLASKDFAELSDAELTTVTALMRQLT